MPELYINKLNDCPKSFRIGFKLYSYNKTNQVIYREKDGIMVVEIWGTYQFAKNPEWIENNVGQWIVDKLNE